MKRCEYKIITSEKGFEDFESKVAEKINNGWKPVGGVSFNMGFPHQAVARVYEEKTKEKKLTANEGMMRLNELT